MRQQDREMKRRSAPWLQHLQRTEEDQRRSEEVVGPGTMAEERAACTISTSIANQFEKNAHMGLVAQVLPLSMLSGITAADQAAREGSNGYAFRSIRIVGRDKDSAALLAGLVAAMRTMLMKYRHESRVGEAMVRETTNSSGEREA